ncbi:MAG: dihydrodipicolinate synthase family protein [Bryobacterales bacterium]|nr:dihydrodipicolinate synthase family protein [Bryobacterales bacterium]
MRTQTKSSLNGVFAALITPIGEDGRVDFETFDQVANFVLDRKVNGIVLGGGTAEYPHFTVEERAALIRRAVALTAGRGQVLASIGASSIYPTLRLANEAVAAGADALLITMPYFFRYAQEDLAAFTAEVCASVPVPCLLYNLPGFTNPIEVQTAIDLLSSIPNLVGMKDSSGNVAAFGPLAAAAAQNGFRLFVGEDSVILPALRAGWDGIISGIASFAPEIITAIYHSHQEGDQARAEALQSSLAEVIARIVQLPIPWAVRTLLAARGIGNGPLHIPLSKHRQDQIGQMLSWFEDWKKAQPFTEVSLTGNHKTLSYSAKRKAS